MLQEILSAKSAPDDLNREDASFNLLQPPLITVLGVALRHGLCAAQCSLGIPSAQINSAGIAGALGIAGEYALFGRIGTSL